MSQPPTPRVAVNVGDILVTPRGEEEVLQVNYAADWIETAGGGWPFEELEVIAPPDIKDPESVERWLGIAGQIIPRRRVENRMVTCSCDCSNCYRVDMWEPVEGTSRINNFRTSHFRNNSQCACDREGCSCRS